MESVVVHPARDCLHQCLADEMSYPEVVYQELSGMWRLLFCSALDESRYFVKSMMIVYRDLREDAGRENTQQEVNNRTEVL